VSLLIPRGQQGWAPALACKVTLGPITRDAGIRRAWRREVALPDGRRFRVGVYQGDPRRAMYGRRGYAWIGWVADIATGKQLWISRVDKSCGAARLLAFAMDAKAIPDQMEEGRRDAT
jgi:hypothetical protein